MHTTESTIDGVFTKNIIHSKFVHLNLVDQLGTDGHLGQLGVIKHNLKGFELGRDSFKRKIASDTEIFNLGVKSWGLITKILDDKKLTDVNKSYQLLHYLKLLVNLSEPETVGQIKVKLCQPVLNEYTVLWMRRMNFLREKMKTDKSEHTKATFRFVRKHYRKLRRNDQNHC